MSSKLENLVGEIKEELTTLSVTREEYLAVCAQERIQKQTENYNKEFDKYLELLEINELNEKELSRVSDSLIALSKVISSSYESLIKEITKYKNKFF